MTTSDTVEMHQTCFTNNCIGTVGVSEILLSAAVLTPSPSGAGSGFFLTLLDLIKHLSGQWSVKNVTDLVTTLIVPRAAVCNLHAQLTKCQHCFNL